MPAPIYIDFIARGMPDIQKAFRTVEDAVVRSERASTQTTQRESKARSRTIDREARDKVKAWALADREVAKAQRTAEREADRAAKAESRAAERAAREKVQAWKRADKEIARSRQAGAREAERLARSEAREASRVERDKNREAMQWVRRRTAEQRQERRARERFATNIVGAAGRGFTNGLQRASSLALGAANAVTQLGGGFSLTDSVQRKVALRGKLADIANRGIIDGDAKNAQRKNVGDLEGAVRATGAQYGIDPEQAADALDKFASKTGDLSTGLELLKGLGELSRAGAGSLDDLADAAGDIFSADTKQSAEDVLNTLRVVAVQGQKGAVEMKDLASQMAKLGAAAGKFEGPSGKNIATMGALAQLARQGGGASSATQATTSVQSLTNQFYKNARIEGFKNLGVDVKTKEGFNRNIDDVLVETMLGAEKKSRASGHGMKDFDVLFGGAVADAQARRSTLALEKTFKKAGGGKAGADAVRAKLAEFGSGGRDLKAEFADKASARMQEDDVKVEQAMQKLRNAAADKLLPAFMNLVDPLQKLIPQFAKLLESLAGWIDWAAKNPFPAMGAVIAASIVTEIGKAAIGEAIKNKLVSLLSRGGSTPSPTPSPAGAPGAGGGGGGVLGAAIGVGMATAGLIVKKNLALETGNEEAQDYAAKLRAYAAGDRDRGMSPEQVRKKLAEAQGRLDNTGTLETVANLATSPFVDASDRDYKRNAADQALTENPELKKALAEVTTALRDNTAARNGGSSGVGGAARDQNIAQRSGL